MPTNNLGYAMAATNLVMEGARIRSMADYNRASMMTDAVQRIPGGVANLVGARDARREQAEIAQLRNLQRRTGELHLARQMKDFADDQAISDIYKLTPRTETGEPDYRRLGTEVSFIDAARAAPLFQADEAATARMQRQLQEDNEAIANALFDVKDQAGWDRAINRLAKRPGLLGRAAPLLQKQFDTDFRDTILRERPSRRSWRRRIARCFERMAATGGDLRGALRAGRGRR
jgi:hypothetical protein